MVEKLYMFSQKCVKFATFLEMKRAECFCGFMWDTAEYSPNFSENVRSKNIQFSRRNFGCFHDKKDSAMATNFCKKSLLDDILRKTGTGQWCFLREKNSENQKISIAFLRSICYTEATKKHSEILCFALIRF